MDTLDDLKREFGYVPDAVAIVVSRLWARVHRLEPPRPQDLGYAWINGGVKHSTMANEALIDARSILTAFAREVASPRPALGDLARAQGISLSALRRRYTPAQAESIKHLVNDTGTIDEILEPFKSLFDVDLRDVSALRDEEIATRDTIAELYAQREDLLAEQIGAETRADLTPPDGAEDLQPPFPPYYDKPEFKAGKLYPGRRRRLLSEYNPRVMFDALESAPPILKSQWLAWTIDTAPPDAAQTYIEDDSDAPPF